MNRWLTTGAYLAALWYLMASQNHSGDDFQLDLTARRIKVWRAAAEYCGRRVITLEEHHGRLAERNRTV